MHGHGMQTERACCTTSKRSRPGSCAPHRWTFAPQKLISQSCVTAVNKIVCGRTDQCDMLTSEGKTVHPPGGPASAAKVTFHASWFWEYHKAAGYLSVGVRLLLTP